MAKYTSRGSPASVICNVTTLCRHYCGIMLGMSVLHQHVGAWLGVRQPRTEQELLDIVEQQLPTSSIKRLLALGVTRAEVDSVVIPSRTLQHRRSRREKLPVEQSDRVLR